MSASTQTLSPPARLHDLLGLLLTLLALVVAYKLAVPMPLAPTTTLPPALCDLQRENCRLTLPGNLAVDLKIPDRPVVPNRGFVVEANGGDGRIKLLELDIRGVDVEMSGPPIAFASAGNGHFRALASFPVCTTRRMTWQMTVLLTVDGQDLKWPLRFQTGSGAWPAI